MEKINTQRELINLFSEVTGLNKSSSKMAFEAMEAFIEHCVENQIPFRSSAFELYFSTMKGRETVKVGTKDMRVKMPPVIKARMKVADRFRLMQRENNKIARPILEKIESSQTLTDLE